LRGFESAKNGKRLGSVTYLIFFKVEIRPLTVFSMVP